MGTDASRPTPADLALAAALLDEAPFAYVGMVDEHTRPYVVPMSFAYEPGEPVETHTGTRERRTLGRIHLHTGEGRKSAALARDPWICLAVTCDADFDQGPTPCRDGYSFRSVLAEGSATLLEDDAERERALRSIVAKYDPEAVDLPFEQDALAATLVYTVEIKRMTFKTLPRRGGA